MRVLVQRVREANVSVADREVGRIGPGLVALVGFGSDDDASELASMAKKIATLRIFEDAQAKMNLSVLESGAAILVVSQFTLFADTSRGRRPSFVGALHPKLAEKLYTAFCDELSRQGLSVERGVFGAHMEVTLVNTGPVTIWLDSKLP